MGAQIKFTKEEYALGMVQRENSNNSLLMDAQTLLKREECVLGMEQRPNDAASKDAQIKLRMEDCA